MKHFLVPIDFSDNSLPSCHYAIELAGNEKTEIYLFHIFPNQIMIPDSSFPAGIDSDAFLNTEYIIGLRVHAEERMNQFQQDLQIEIDKRGLMNIQLNSMVAGGDPEWEINAIGDEIHPNMIVMGTRGAGNKGFLEGSMAEEIMIKSAIPVVAVPESYQKFRLKNVMYATDFNQVDTLKIEKLFTIFSHFKIQVHVVHIQLSDKTENVKEKMNELKSSFKNDFKDRDVHFHLIDTEDKMETLEAFTENHSIDLIAFISHKSNFFKNLFSNKINKKDFFNLELPMLAMHEQVY